MKRTGWLLIAVLATGVFGAACSGGGEDDNDFIPGTQTPIVPADPFSGETSFRSNDSKDVFFQSTATFDGFLLSMAATNSTGCTFELTEGTVELEDGTVTTTLVDRVGTCNWSGSVEFRSTFATALNPDLTLFDDVDSTPATTFPAGSTAITISDASVAGGKLRWAMSTNVSVFLDEVRIYDSNENLVGGCSPAEFVETGATALVDICDTAVATSAGTYSAVILGGIPAEKGNYYQQTTFTLP